MTPEQYAYYMQQWYEADPEAYKAAYEQYEAQLAASQQTQPEAESDRKRPDWLQEIASKSQRRSPSRDEPAEQPAAEVAEKPVGPGGRVWDERWGYCKPNFDRMGSGGKGKGKGGGKGGGPSAGGKAPPSRGLKLQRCPKWGQAHAFPAPDAPHAPCCSPAAPHRAPALLPVRAL
jgi:hypothetical protein